MNIHRRAFVRAYYLEVSITFVKAFCVVVFLAIQNGFCGTDLAPVKKPSSLSVLNLLTAGVFCDFIFFAQLKIFAFFLVKKGFEG